MLTKKRIENLWAESDCDCYCCVEPSHAEDHLLRFARLVEAAALENAAKVRVYEFGANDSCVTAMLRTRARKAREAAGGER